MPTVSLRCSEAERVEWMSLARARNLTLSTLIREGISAKAREPETVGSQAGQSLSGSSIKFDNQNGKLDVDPMACPSCRRRLREGKPLAPDCVVCQAVLANTKKAGSPQNEIAPPKMRLCMHCIRMGEFPNCKGCMLYSLCDRCKEVGWATCESCRHAFPEIVNPDFSEYVESLARQSAEVPPEGPKGSE
jgi:hypothetical protein